MFGVGRVLSCRQGLEARLCLAVIVIPEKVFSTFIVRNLRSLRSLSVARTGTVSHATTASLGALGPSGPVGPGVGNTLLDEALLGLEGRAGAGVRVVGRVGAVSSSGLNATGSTAMRARRPATPTGPSLRPCIGCTHSLLRRITVIVIVAVPIASVTPTPGALYLATVSAIFLKHS